MEKNSNNHYLSVFDMGDHNKSLTVKFIIQFLIFVYLFACSFNSTLARTESSSLKIVWLGTSTIYISDGETGLLFDPFITRPGKSKVFSFQKLESDTVLIEEWHEKLTKDHGIHAIFVSHTHYDHVLDLEEFANLSNADVYGSKSAEKIIQAENIKRSKDGLQKIHHTNIYSPQNDTIQSKYQTILVGEFKITILPARHAPHLPKFNFTALKGEIKDTFKSPASVLKYKMDENFSFFIHHDAGNILFHPSSEIVCFPNFDGTADVVIQGIKGETSSQDLLNEIIKPFGAKVVIPVHHDYFFWPLKKGVAHFTSVDLEEFTSIMENAGIFVPKLYFGTEYIYQ